MARRRRRRGGSREPREVVIESLSHEGRGITHVNGKTIFVAGALPGERVTAQVYQSTRKFDQAITLEVLEAAPQRIEPGCAAYQVCGGCSLQHVDSETQLELKQAALAEQMAHAGVDVGEWLPPLRSMSWGYRRKARLGVKHVPKKERVLVGFRERSTPFIADMRACEVLLPEVGHQLEALSDLIGELEARARIPQIEVAADAQTITLVFRHLDPLSAADLERLSRFGREQGFAIQLQPGGPDSVHNLYPDAQQMVLRPLAEDDICIEFAALDFIQVNPELNQQMVAQALTLLDLQSTDRVLDLFCGLGNFTLPMARRCAGVCGVEVEASMVERARRAAVANAIDNSEYRVADLDQPDPSADWLGRRYDKILLDPPRSGALAIVKLLARLEASRIVYVSCQPSSLVRDAAIICEQGYQMTHLGIMDMFPQTAHVESMAVFQRRTGG